MGVRILEDHTSGDAVLYCSTSMWAFGPIFENHDEAQGFLDWLRPVDPRTLSDKDLEAYVSTFRGLPNEVRHDSQDR